MDHKVRHFGQLFGIFLCFVGLGIFFLFQRRGIFYTPGENRAPGAFGPREYTEKDVDEEHTCLVVCDSSQPESMAFMEEFRQVLLDMRVSYQETDAADGLSLELSSYETAVFALSDLECLRDHITELSGWVKGGGRAMFPISLQRTPVMDLLSQRFGIMEMGYEYSRVDSIALADGFMAGGDGVYPIDDGYESALGLRVRDDCKIYASEGTTGLPLIWSADFGDGKFVMVNMGFYEKAYRGFYSSAYTLLEDIAVYPVINGSVFYIDDFPSPVPSGNGEYVMRDYGMSIGNFYSSVWWPDMLKIQDQYGLRYTGLIIETYEDHTGIGLPRNEDIADYGYFGNMILVKGGELGIHGYNHQPLCLDTFQYEEDLGYNAWESREAMVSALTEVLSFSKELYPEEEFHVYVPPSNVLSPEGRQVLGNDFPNITSIASVYLPGESAYDQEFEIAQDGIAETPRIISGFNVDDYMRIAALSELNLHFVNSQFVHPDDLLDEDRGAALGWEYLKGRTTAYFDWLYGSVPSIRRLTGSQMSEAVRQYCALRLWKLPEEETLYITAEGVREEAWLIIRVNEGSLGEVKGGELTQLTDSLYLLKVTDRDIEIMRNR